MTGGKITLIIFNAVFAAVLIVLLWVCSAKSLEHSQKMAAIRAHQATLKGLVDEWDFLLNRVVGTGEGDQKSPGVTRWRYKASGWGPDGDDDGPIAGREKDFFRGQPTPDGLPRMPAWTLDEGRAVVEEEQSKNELHPHLLQSQIAIEQKRSGDRRGDDRIRNEKQEFEFADAEAQKKRQAFVDATATVEPAWARLKETNQDAVQQMRSLVTDWQQNQDRYLSSEANLRNEIYRKKVSLVRMKIDHQKQQANWARQENQMSEDIENTTNHSLSKALRETRSNELQADGMVLDATVAEYDMVTVDIGRRNNVREGLIFTVYSTYSGQNDVKGEVQVVEVRETTSVCKVLHRPREMYISDRTQWKTSDPRVNYDPLGSRRVAGSAELRPEPVRPHSPASERQDVLDQLIPPKTHAYNENPQATGILRPGYDTESTNPIQKGDMVASAEFQPVISQREAAKRFYSEMAELRDVSLERLNFAMMPDFSDNEVSFLRRTIKSNGCVAHDAIQPRTNFLVVREPLSEYVATNADRLRFLIDTNDKSGRGQDPASKLGILSAERGKALTLAQQYNTRIMTMDEANTFFQQRRRKADLLSGKLELGGRSVFYVAGQSATRSRNQIENFIRESNGLVTHQLSDEVDWLVAGAGSEKDIEQAKKLGVRILREKDLEGFFAHTGSGSGQ